MILKHSRVAEVARRWAFEQPPSNLWRDRLRPVIAIATAFLLIGRDQASAAPPATVVAKASTNSVQVAQPFTLEWTVTAPVGAAVAFPSIGKQFGEFDVVDTEDLFDIPGGTAVDARTWTRRLTLESIATGELKVPTMEIQVSESGETKTIRSNPITVQVVSVLEDRGDPTQFRDIQSVVDVNVPTIRSNAWVWWTISGAAGLALLAAVGMVVARRGKWLTPKDWALRELDELENTVDSTTASSEAITSELSKIVRDYLQLQLAIPESGHTPQELVRLIVSNKQIDTEITNLLSALFTLADKANFAGLQLSKAGLKSAIGDSRELVQRIADDAETASHTTDTMESK